MLAAGTPLAFASQVGSLVADMNPTAFVSEVAPRAGPDQRFAASRRRAFLRL